MFSLLNIDPSGNKPPYGELKKRFTPQVVHDIHVAITELWPDVTDYDKCLSNEPDQATALYTGNYDPDSVLSAVTRHALYSEKIYLIDTFIYPGSVREEFDPVIHPEEHQANTIQSSYLWLQLLPWIKAGIVSFIRPPRDFVAGLKLMTIEIERARFKKHPDLEKIVESLADKAVGKGPLDRGFAEYYFLSMSDEELVKDLEKFPEVGSKEDYLKYINRRRAEHPYWIEPSYGNTSFLIQTSGANYELSKIAAAATKAHLITDLESRWKEMEIDREEGGDNSKIWGPFAKALQNSKLKILDEVSLDGVYRLRSENRLEALRLFFNKVWRSCRESNEFAEANAVNLASELTEQVNEAEAEWKKIDIDLVKWGTSGSLAVASAIGFLPEAVTELAVGGASAGIFALAQSHLRRASFKNQYPAGFFLGPHKG
jgi:hypothetical protein